MEGDVESEYIIKCEKGNNKLKVLNLYCGIGGNRKLWKDVEVTAIEINPEIAEIYRNLYPGDKVIVGDAHKFLIDHFSEYDFIWSSPPCPTHSRINHSFNGCKKNIVRYADMKLYEEIILLLKYRKKPWLIENVIPYYEPLIKPAAYRDRHCFWSNFQIDSHSVVNSADQPIANVTNGSERFGFSLKEYKAKDKRKILRNLVNPKLGLYLFERAFKIQQKTLRNNLDYRK